MAFFEVFVRISYIISISVWLVLNARKSFSFQIYDMILVRHGLMIVGDPLGGKTTAFKVLADALHDLHQQGLMEEFGVCLSK